MILIPYRRGNRQQGITDASCAWNAPRKRRQRRPAICWNRLSQFSTSCRLLLPLRPTKRKHSSLDIPVVLLEEVAEILNEEQMEENEEDILRKKKVVFDNLQLKHPITYKSYNLCKLAADETLATKLVLPN